MNDFEINKIRLRIKKMDINDLMLLISNRPEVSKYNSLTAAIKNRTEELHKENKIAG